MTTAVAQAPIPDTVKSKAVDVASVSVVSPDDPRWLAFLSASPGATPFHHPAWARTISATYGLRPFAVVLTAGDKVLAGLPAIETRSLLRTRRWVSLPFTDACGPLAITPAASEA
jgi:CelD/BcsL family acetyltransferase involved in cellulose biosynthesis